jgi:putative membrane protein
MKKFVSYAFACCILCACNNNNQPKDAVDSAKKDNAEKQPEAIKDSLNKGDTVKTTAITVDKNDADFAVEAADGGTMEIEYGRMAQSKGYNERVKNFGAMMVKDHGMMADKLKKLAMSKNITLPTEMDNKKQKKMMDLSAKQGKDFDKAYLNMMLDDHKEDLKAFKKAAEKCADPDLKSFAADAVPVIQKHLDSVKAISGKN